MALPRDVEDGVHPEVGARRLDLDVRDLVREALLGDAPIPVLLVRGREPRHACAVNIELPADGLSLVRKRDVPGAGTGHPADLVAEACDRRRVHAGSPKPEERIVEIFVSPGHDCSVTEERADDCALCEELRERVERDGHCDDREHDGFDDARGVGREGIWDGGEPDHVVEVEDRE